MFASAGSAPGNDRPRSRPGVRPSRGRRARAVLLPQLLTAGVEANASRMALSFDGISVPYRELDRRSSQLARVLVERGIGPESFVALGFTRSIESVLALWAVAKSGAAFVPVDPNYPTDRIVHMIGDSGVVLGLTTKNHRDSLPDSVDWLVLDDAGFLATVTRQPDRPISYADRIRPLLEEHAAYVIYTSGSTGKPKGVVVTHAGLAGLVLAEREHYSVTAESRVLHVCSPSFDVSVLELLLAFSSGATLVIAPPSVFGGAELAELLATERVSHMLITPAALGSVDPAGLDDLRVVVVAGDAFGPELVSKWAPGRQFFNGYGPTEATILATSSAALHPGEPITIGSVVPGVSAFVLDARLRPVPAGVAGELYLSGVQLARGYLRRPGLTAERFVASPFGNAGERLYRTGDVVRRREDRAYEYLGRSDFQVKIRGFRIELGEIDAALAAHPDIEFAATMGSELVPGATSLVSYVLPVAGAEIDTVKLLEFVAQVLPGYMVPAVVSVLDEIPLTPVGKLDRAALPAPVLEAAEFRAPTTPVEEIVAGVFAEILGVERVGLDDDFFALGGNSLIATQLIARLGAALDAQIPLPTLFESSSVEALAAAAESHAGLGGTKALKPGPRPGRVPLSLAQSRMWFLNRFEPDSAVNNIPVAIRLSGSLDVA
ncbi:amino acid adenylation domain-containing protein, partial [Rhodococcus sp. WS4]